MSYGYDALDRLTSSQSPARYQYAFSNPTTNWDPDGHLCAKRGSTDALPLGCGAPPVQAWQNVQMPPSSLPSTSSKPSKPTPNGPNDKNDVPATHETFGMSFWDTLLVINKLNSLANPEWLKTLELGMFNLLTGTAGGILAATGCAATAFVGCVAVSLAVIMATITLQGAMKSAASGEDPIQGAASSLHDVDAWIQAVFDGGIGGYFKFKLW